MWAELFPSPHVSAPDARVFRAWHYWESNVCATAVAALGVCALFLVLAGQMVWLTKSISWLPALLILNGIGAPLALLLGNLAAFYPFAVEIQQGKALCFYAPFKKIRVPIHDVDRVKWSWLWVGWVVRLKERRGLLKWFIIHAAWGRQGRELARAIEVELGREAHPLGCNGCPILAYCARVAHTLRFVQCVRVKKAISERCSHERSTLPSRAERRTGLLPPRIDDGPDTASDRGNNHATHLPEHHPPNP